MINYSIFIQIISGEEYHTLICKNPYKTLQFLKN